MQLLVSFCFHVWKYQMALSLSIPFCIVALSVAAASFICYITYVHPPSDPIQVCYFYALIPQGSALIIAILLRAFLISCQNQNRTQFPNENVSISICNFTLTKSPIVASFWKPIALLVGLLVFLIWKSSLPNRASHFSWFSVTRLGCA